MKKPTAVALIGCLIGLAVYVAISWAGLVRDLDTAGVRSAPVETVARGAVPEGDMQTQPGDAKTEVRVSQAKPTHKHKVRTLSHHVRQRLRQDPVTMLL